MPSSSLVPCHELRFFQKGCHLKFLTKVTYRLIFALGGSPKIRDCYQGEKKGRIMLRERKIAMFSVLPFSGEILVTHSLVGATRIHDSPLSVG